MLVNTGQYCLTPLLLAWLLQVELAKIRQQAAAEAAAAAAKASSTAGKGKAGAKGAAAAARRNSQDIQVTRVVEKGPKQCEACMWNPVFSCGCLHEAKLQQEYALQSLLHAAELSTQHDGGLLSTSATCLRMCRLTQSALSVLSVPRRAATRLSKQGASWMPLRPTARQSSCTQATLCMLTTGPWHI
jgi:hypothetical protein